MRERRARREIAAYGRELWDRRLVTGTSGNISIRLSCGDILCTPAARSLRNLHPDEVVLLDAAGAPRDPLQRATSELALHLSAYAVRADMNAVIHSHPTYCVVWSRTGSLFARDTVGARETLSEVAFTAYRPAGSIELAGLSAAEFAAGANNVLMERHGLTCIAPSLEEAFIQTDLAEEAARIAFLGAGLSGAEGTYTGLRQESLP